MQTIGIHPSHFDYPLHFSREPPQKCLLVVSSGMCSLASGISESAQWSWDSSVLPYLSVAHSFRLLRIRRVVRETSYFFTPLLPDTGLFCVIINRAATDIPIRVWLCHKFSSSWVNISEWNLGSHGEHMFNFTRTCHFFSKLLLPARRSRRHVSLTSDIFLPTRKIEWACRKQSENF